MRTFSQTADLTTSGTPNTATRMVAASTPTRFAIIFVDESNAAGIRIGPTSAASAKLIAADQWYVIQVPDAMGDRVDLNDWYVKSTSASMTYRIIYLP